MQDARHRGMVLMLPILVACAAWLAASPWALGYAHHPQCVSDLASAAALFGIAVASVVLRRPRVRWLAAAVGLWLILSPIVLWAATAAAYASATITGTVVTFVGFVLPTMRRGPGPAIPDGWSYNPSTWPQRVPVIVLTLLSMPLAMYMAVYQLGYIDTMWDPVFGDGTRRVLTSSVSHAFPVSDAGLGAAMYLIDLVMTCAGDPRRWRTMPWLVLVFGVLIIPVGIVSVVLVVLQPVAVGAWCFWCLITASATLAMVPLAIDEVAATLQLLRAARRDGRPWLQLVWHGDATAGRDEPVPERVDVAGIPWSLVVIGGVGLWLMVEPAALGTTGAHAASTTITGALVLVIAAVAASEIARPVRYAAALVGAWIIAAPWLLAGSTPTSHLSDLVAGIVLVPASMLPVPVHEHRASLDRVALWPAP